MHGAACADDARIPLVEHGGDVVQADDGKGPADIVGGKNGIRYFVPVPPQLAPQLEVVPVVAENEIARDVEEIEAHVASPLVIESEPPRHCLARPQHPQLAERTRPVPVGGAHAARFVARRRARVPRSVRVDQGDVRAHLAQMIRCEASPDPRANDDDVRRRTTAHHRASRRCSFGMRGVAEQDQPSTSSSGFDEITSIEMASGVRLVAHVSSPFLAAQQTAPARQNMARSSV